MSEIICYVPTYSPNTEADTEFPRSYIRLDNSEIQQRMASGHGNVKPWLYMDCIDSILNIRPDINLVVADGRSADSIRAAMVTHHRMSEQKVEGAINWHGFYQLQFYSERLSQWWIFNDIILKHATDKTKYFVYSSSDVVWHHDWVSEAIKEFEKNPKVQILFPCVNKGDPNLPCQIAPGPRDMDSFVPPYQEAAKAPVLNAYAMIFRMDFLRLYGGYPNVYKNCFTESFLHFMCEAMGGEMRVLPRGHCYHYGEGDKWSPPGGSPYNYNEEKMKFQAMINKVLMTRAMKMMSVDFLKGLLYV
jgi:hypothetical protein